MHVDARLLAVKVLIPCACLKSIANRHHGPVSVRMAGHTFLLSLLMQSGQYQEASKAAIKVEGHQKAVTTLLVANAYEQDDLAGCRRQLDKCAPEDPDSMVNTGCILFKVRHAL